MFRCTKNVKFHFQGIQNHETKNRRLGTNVASFQDFKLCKNRFLRHFLISLQTMLTIRKWLRNLLFAKLEVLKWHNHSQSPVFGFVVLDPLEMKFYVFGTSKHREGKSLSNLFFCILISTLGRFNRAVLDISQVWLLTFQVLAL